MPTNAPLVLKDRATPQVDHTFNPRDVVGSVATFTESVDGVPLADRRIVLSLNRTPTRVKAIAKFAIPVVQDVVVGGVTKPTIVRTAYAELMFNFDPATNTRERDDLVGFVHDFTKWADNPIVGGVIVDLEGIWG
jgi:hypothetical protein